MTYYVGKNGRNEAGAGTQETPFLTIQYAIGQAAGGDTILVAPGVYREKVTIDKPLVVESAEMWGAIIDGGYGPELAKKSATGKWVVPTVPKANTGWLPNREYGGLVEIGAQVVFSGFTVRNAAGMGIKLINETAASRTVIEDCRIDWTYDGAIGLGGLGYRLQGVKIVGNTITRSSVRLFDPLRDGGGPESVATTIKPIHCDDTEILYNIVMWCFGEGISAARGSERTRIEENVIGPCYHWLAGNQRGRNATICNNFIFHNADPMFINAKGEIPDGLVIGDEGASSVSGEGYGPQIYNNVIVNCGEGLGLRATGNYTTRMKAMYVGYNLFWQGPAGRWALDIETGRTDAGAWRDHENNLIENNVIVGATKQTRAQGVYYRNNGWTEAPPDGMRGAGDVVMPRPEAMPLPALPAFVLNAAECVVPNYEDLMSFAESYRLAAGSPAIGAASDGSPIAAGGFTITPPAVTGDFADTTRVRPGDIGAFEYTEPEEPEEPDMPEEPKEEHDLTLEWDAEAGVITATCGGQVKSALITAYTSVVVTVEPLESES